MAEQRYISKIHVGNFSYDVKDHYAIHNVDDLTIFKDATGKYFKLSKNNDIISIAEHIYNPPTISINLKKYQLKQDIGALTQTNSYEIDHFSSSSISLNIKGTIETQYAETDPECNNLTIIKGSLENGKQIYDVNGNIDVPNNGSVTLTITGVTGSEINPETGIKTTTPSQTYTISTTTSKTYGYFLHSDALSDTVAGKTTGFAGEVTIRNEATTINVPTTAITKTQEVVNTGEVGEKYLYIIYTSNTENLIANIDKGTVDSAKLGGGVQHVGTITMYSINKTYQLYRSENKINANKIYFKLLS